MKKVILICFSSFCFMMEIFLLYTDIYLIDKCLVLSGIFGQMSLVIGLLFDLPILNEFIHIIYALLIIVIPLISFNNYLLLIHILIIIWTLSIRKVFNQCIWRSFENKKKQIKQPNINWDMLFPSLGSISVCKIVANLQTGNNT